jgi:hypothetical protein
MTCFGQMDTWERVKLIETGKKVSVALQGGKSVSGKMREWSPESITLLQGRDKVVQVARSEVKTVAFSAGMSRGRRALWAGSIGGAAGAAIGAAACVSTSSDCDVPPAAIAAGGALWIGGIAAGIAALIPQHKETVYIATPAGVKPSSNAK